MPPMGAGGALGAAAATAHNGAQRGGAARAEAEGELLKVTEFDYFERLDEAVARAAQRPVAGARLPPLLSRDVLFTLAVPCGVSGDMFYRSPSNRIGMYYSPQTADLNAAELGTGKSRREPLPPVLLNAAAKAKRERDQVTTTPAQRATMRRTKRAWAGGPLTGNVGGGGGVGGAAGDARSAAIGGAPAADRSGSYSARRAEATARAAEAAVLAAEQALPAAGGSLADAGYGRDTPIAGARARLPERTAPADAARLAALADEVVRYQWYIEHGVDTSLLAPFRDEWLDNALLFVPEGPGPGVSQARFDFIVDECQEEVQLDYEGAAKKAVVDYALLDAAERDRLALTSVKTVMQGKPDVESDVGRELPWEWREAVTAAHAAMEERLHVLSPHTLQLANIWEAFGSKLLVDTRSADFLRAMPFELDGFLNWQRESCERVREALWKEWIPAAVAVFRRDPPRPIAGTPEALSAFYDSASTLMSNQLRRLTDESVHAFEALFAPFDSCALDPTAPTGLTPIFRVAIELAPGGAYVLSPSWPELEGALRECLTSVVLAPAGLPRPDAEISRRDGAALTTMAADDEVVQGVAQRVAACVRRNEEGAAAVVAMFDAFRELAETDVNAVCEEFDAANKPTGMQTTVKAYAEAVDRYRVLADEVFAAAPVTLRVGLVEVSTEPIKTALRDKALSLAHQLLRQVLGRMRATNADVIERYEKIQNEVTSLSSTSDDIVGMRKYVAALPTELRKLDAEIKVNTEREEFLEQYHFEMPEEDFRMLFVAYEWPKKVTTVLETNTAKIEEEHDRFEAALKSRRADFVELLGAYDEQLAVLDSAGELEKTEAYAEQVRELDTKLADAAATAEEINREEGLFSLPLTKFNSIATMRSALEPFIRLWTTAADFKTKENEWMNAPFGTLEPEAIETAVGEMWRVVYKLTKSFGGEDPKEAPLKVAEATKANIDKMKEVMPLISCLCNPGLRDRHWKAISEALGFELSSSDSSSFRQLLRLQVADKIEVLTELSEGASKEYSLEKTLDKMLSEWAPLEFEISLYRETGTYILKGGPVDEAQMLLDDHIIKTQSMGASPSAKPFEDRIKDWGRRVTAMQDIIDEWLKVQSVWLYLEPIFGSEDIMQQMPTEGAAFKEVDQAWRGIMSETKEKPAMLATADRAGLLETLRESNAKLDIIQKGLDAYLNSKRLAFPRFFFLANDELLEILSETKDPLRVQPFLKKCFEGIKTLDFDDKDDPASPNHLNIIAMNSAEDERVEMTRIANPKSAGGNVEKWLIDVETIMRETLVAKAAEGVAHYLQVERTKWVVSHPGMLVLCGSQIYWTREVSEALNTAGTAGLKKYEGQCTAQLADIVNMVRGKLSKMERKTLSALVTIDVHARDVVADMAAKGVSSVSDFDWLAQLRYDLDAEGVVWVSMINARKRYGYEYLGNSSRLVITPLTDRCYRTLMGALHLNLGGAPEGPAGTGKTETTKDLAKALAMQCIVFNCSDSLDYLAMAKFFKGLAASGAWACFDEFNRIDLEVLSVVAQQILTIQRAVAAKQDRFFFEGTDLQLVRTCAVFITMNPGYAGRSELPDNLKSLFRPVAMMVPNYAMIAEILLYSNGYLQARDMARKLVATYRLCSEQLSSQDHYDYGMRAVIAVLRAAGNLKRKYPEEDEAVLMLRAIKDVNLPKFLSHDIDLFNGIMSDLFPGVELPEPDYESLMSAIRANTEKLGLRPVPAFFTKIVQLYEMILVRHGLMVVGQPFGCKTSMYKVLAGALGDLCADGLMEENKTHYHVINPKSIKMGQLYGCFDPVSHEWTDGILATTFRKCSVDTRPDRNWLVFDGPVDAIWIENMNTVLDDNKKLCLMSGEIIQMSEQMNIIYEVADLAVASPATVSRCGMVYVEPSGLGWRPLVEAWMPHLPAGLGDKPRAQIEQLFDWLVPPMLRCATRNSRMLMPMPEANLVQSLMRAFRGLIVELDEEGAAEAMGEKAVAAWVDSLFLFSLVWSLGGCVDEAGRDRFDALLRKLLVNQPPEEYKQYITGAARKVAQTFPDTGLVYDYTFDKKRAKWVGWMDAQPEFRPAADAEFNSLVIPTADTVRYTFLVDLAVSNGHPVLLTGPTGTGKSAYVKSYLLGLDTQRWSSIFFVFSAQTSANQTQDIIDGKLDKRRKGVYGPPMGKKCVVFIDDLNMPALEKYGAQPPVELLRQGIDFGGWYDRKELVLRRLIDVQYVAACGPPGGGRNDVTTRYLRHYHVVATADFADNVLSRIFTSLLDWWMGAKGFGGPITQKKAPLVAASIEIYRTVQRELLPTPAKSHYTFNLRDLSKVFLGTHLAPANMEEGHKLVRIWSNEQLRVFHDRLIDEPDRAWFCKLLCEQIEKHCKDKVSKVFGHLPGAKAGEKGSATFKDLLVGDWMVPGADKRVYDEIIDEEKMVSVLEGYLEDYNATSSKPMPLILFNYAIHHIARVARVLSQPGGNALLVGVGGSGRQSVARLAAYMQDFEVFGIEISKQYGMNEWRDDLRVLLRKAGEQDKATMFLFTDSQIKDEGFVEDLNSILNTGEVPNLFDSSDTAMILDAITPRARQKGRDGTRAELLNFFVDECRRNLHICLCFSPVGGAFRERLRKFPSLVNCTTIDWFTAWPQEALLSVARRFLDDVDAEPKVKAGLVDMAMHFHTSVQELSARYLSQLQRHFYVTPTLYLELINSYKALLAERQKAVAGLRKRYEVGLEQLLTAESAVGDMRVELEELKPGLIVAGKEVEELMVVIDGETIEANKVRVVVQAEEEVASKKAAEAKAIKDETEGELAVAMPLLESALKALDTLTKSDVTELKGMKSPPAGVKLVLEAVCILKGIKAARVKDSNGKMVEDYWGPAKTMMTDTQFLPSLQTYDKDNIPPAVVNKVRPYVNNPDMAQEVIKKASKAAYGLCCWVGAMEAYDRVAKVVEPKRAALKVAEAEYEVVMTGLREKQAELKVVEDKLADLDAKLKGAQAKKKQLQDDVDLCNAKLERAAQLIGGLGGEKTRWTAVAEQYGVQYDKLMGDVMLAAGVLSYLGAFTPAFRAEAVTEWVAATQEKGLPCSAKFSLEAVLGDPVQTRQWNIDGLPKDSFSCENGIIVDKARRWPLFIDPQGQANNWVRSMNKDKGLVVIKLSDGDFLRQLENAIQFGKPVLLENVGEELDPSLESLLLKQTFKSGGEICIKLGDAVVAFSPEFRFFITTKLPNPHYSPETSVKVSLVNFLITPEGLLDQLLGIVVAKERPDLEEEKSALVLQGAENKKSLAEIEDKILNVLSAADNILEDESGVAVLSASKTLSDEINAKQKVAEETEEKIDEARQGYMPVADRAQVLFFCVSDMGAIEPMYQYSLPWFVDLFVRSIAASEKSDDLAKRMENLNGHFQYSLYCNVCRSLFEKDKLLFSYHVATRIMINEGELEDAHARFLLTGGVALEDPPPKPDAAWISDKAWGEYFRLSSLAPELEGLAELVAGNLPAFQVVYDSPTPEREPLPCGLEGRVTPFQRLLLLRALRLDKVEAGVARFVAQRIGDRFIEPPPLNLAQCFADSTVSQPLIFVLSPGSDPMTSLLKFASDQGVEIESVSLGQGQGPIAAKAMRKAFAAGSWVVLQNCHLAVSWMPTLEKICEQEMVAGKVHERFRLWLTSYPSPHFPVVLLQSGVKIVQESPKGLRANLTRSYLMDPISDPAFFGSCTKETEWRRLLFGLCFMHAFVQERCSFGPLGWNIPYAFSESDLRISVRQLAMFLDEYPEEVPFPALRYLTAECNYGGRVTDDHDRRTLNTILNGIYCPAFLEDGHAFSESGDFAVPEHGPYDHYLEYIKKLPIEAPPEVYGFHNNAAIVREINSAEQLFDSLLTAGGGGGGAGGAGRDELVFSVSDDVLKRVPEPFDIEAVQQKYPVLYMESMNVVLAQECVRYNRLISVIRSSAVELKKAVKGLVVMSSTLDTVAQAMVDGKIPALWAAKSYPSRMPLASYINDLIERLAMLQGWINTGAPVLFWMPGFFFTQAFLTATRQNYARREKIPIDLLDFDFEVMDEDGACDEKPEDGVYVRGLFLEGARWNLERHVLDEAEPKVLYSPAPNMWLKPIEVIDIDLSEPHFVCPIYKTSERRGVLSTTGHSTNFVMDVRLPSDKPQDFWIKRGVALLSQLDS